MRSILLVLIPDSLADFQCYLPSRWDIYLIWKGINQAFVISMITWFQLSPDNNQNGVLNLGHQLAHDQQDILDFSLSDDEIKVVLWCIEW